jgi:hypothetical protein
MELKYICLHWTAGGLSPNASDKKHYHFSVDSKGVVHAGRYKPEANGKQLSNRDKYAAHCGGGNSFRIGIAVCGGPKGFKHGAFTRDSYEAACKKIAELCVKYGIEVTPETVHTHYEFGLRHPSTRSAGKIDINQLPWDPTVKPQDVGDSMRNTVKWYQSQL